MFFNFSAYIEKYRKRAFKSEKFVKIRIFDDKDFWRKSTFQLLSLSALILFQHTYTHTRTHARTHTHIYIYIYVCVCVYMYMYIYVYICMYIYNGLRHIKYTSKDYYYYYYYHYYYYYYYYYYCTYPAWFAFLSVDFITSWNWSREKRESA